MADGKIPISLEMDSTSYQDFGGPGKTLESEFFSFNLVEPPVKGSSGQTDAGLGLSDSRNSLHSVGIDFVFLSVVIPVSSYILQKIFDAVLDDLGKTLSGVLRDWIGKPKKNGEAEKHSAYLIISLGNIKYLVAIKDGQILDGLSDITPLLGSILTHFNSSPQNHMYQIEQRQDEIIIIEFDPFK
jgi:hypothetical protein